MSLTYKQLIEWAEEQDPDEEVNVRLLLKKGEVNEISEGFPVVDVTTTMVKRQPFLIVNPDESDQKLLRPLYNSATLDDCVDALDILEGLREQCEYKQELLDSEA